MIDVNIVLTGEHIKRKSELMYTVPATSMESDSINIKPTEKFYEFVAEQINNYVGKKIRPPVEILPAITNFVDDLSANKKISIRNGDYIMIQEYLRRLKKSV